MTPENPLPHLRKTTRSSQLIVDGEPFLMLAAELHNSTFSNAQYTSKVWPSMKARNINTLLGPVTWDLIEPTEGEFNFNELDQIILDARKHGFRLVLLWFGMYKNALSSHAPQWVRCDPERFPRICIRDEAGGLKVTEAIQPYGVEAQQANAKAFARLMPHLKEFDGVDNTVLMVQVENEIGVMWDARDRSATAENLIHGEAPSQLLKHLQSSWDDLHPYFRSKFPNFQHLNTSAGPLTWTEALGKGEWRDDIFMADAFSRFVDTVASAGRAEYDIPLYVNVALCSEDSSWVDFGEIPAGVPEGERPGQFPSGGPVGHSLDIYVHNAPDIQFYAPDIYLQRYESVAKCFAHKHMPLFIPEQRRDGYGVRRIWTALANNLAIGCSPFGIDSLPLEECHLPLHYGLLSKARRFILDAQANRPDDIFGFYFDNAGESDDAKKSWVKVFGNFEVTVERAFVLGKPVEAAGMIIRQVDGTYLLLGYGYQATFKSTTTTSCFSGVLVAEEMDIDEQGSLHKIRTLNGDETSHHKLITMPSQNPEYDGFPIPFLVPAGTMIASCRPYSLEKSC